MLFVVEYHERLLELRNVKERNNGEVGELDLDNRSHEDSPVRARVA